MGPDVVGGNNLALLFQETRRDLARLVQHRLTGLEDPEDIVQDAFIRLQRAMERQDIKNPRAFLFRITTNLIVDRLRLKRRAQFVSHESDGDEPRRELDALIDRNTPEETIEKRRDLEIVMKAIDELPARARRVFLLSRIDNQTYPEIAKALGISTSGVEKHMGRALRKLREALVNT